MTEPIRLTTPFTEETVASLRTGDAVLLSGIIYTARDAAHKRLVETIERGEEPPIPIAGQVIYYVGPSPTAPGRVIGSAGPTTSYRMDPYAPFLMERGLRGMIGKGKRNEAVKDAMKTNKAVYFAAVGGAGALLARSVKSLEIMAWEDLGPEAVRKLEVVDMPLIVINDVHGGDLYEEGVQKYSR